MKPFEIRPESKAWSFNWVDAVKVFKAFLYSASSLALVLLGAVIALPEVHIPTSLLWVVGAAPFLNAVLYGIQKWISDNR